MKLHIFNPEHDIALARNDKYFTAPKAGRKLHDDCGFIPALWAEDGDYILVNDVAEAQNRLNKILLKPCHVNFVQSKDLYRLPKDLEVEPWGWDSALCFRLEKAGILPSQLPNNKQLETIRKLSNRKFSSSILKELRSKLDVVGESTYVDNIDDIKRILASRERSVLKEPWSSSGRGVRYVGKTLEEPLVNWVRNVIKLQGGVMVEPYYNKVYDFGMEFSSDKDGVHYRGLSLFKTNNGFYEGNVIAPEKDKVEEISRLFPIDKLHKVRLLIESLLSSKLKGKYSGPFGVDMMLIEPACAGEKGITKDPCPESVALASTIQGKDTLLLHPMVEINLRRTMGHVAIDLAKKMEGYSGFMRIDYTKGNYSLVIIQE